VTQIWKVPLKSERYDFEDDPQKIDRARAFCFDEAWIGIGWGIDRLPDDLHHPEEYERALDSPAEYGIEFDIGSARSAHRSMAGKMACGDFAWCRARGDVYWLGRVAGSWIYRNTGVFDDLDLYQIRRCRWVRVGAADEVPGAIKNAYAGRGAAISRIVAQHESALIESAHIWQRRTGEVLPDVPVPTGRSLLSALGHDDLEDLVLLYLQDRLHWGIVASTAKRSTPFTECVLRNAQGQRAYVQVKSGQATVDTSFNLPQEVDCFFLFDLVSPRAGASDQRIGWIEVAELGKFARENLELLPAYLRRLVRK
jgi:hypothetical protein